MSAGRDPRRTPEWRKLREQCFERDKARRAPCWLCGQPIRYDVAASSAPDAYEPDHRLPVEHHPELALVPENVLPSHRRCNRARGKKAGVDNLGRRSRDWRNPRGRG